MAFTPRSLPFFAASLILAASSVARAQGFDAERFTPAAGAESDLAVESPVTPLHLGVGLGLFLNYADDPLVVTDTATGDVVSRPIDSALTADLIASIGLFDRFELGAQIPVHIIYDGDSTASEGAGDLHLVPKLTLLGAGDVDSHFVLGLGVPVTLPTGDEDELRGAGGFSIEPRLLALWRMGRLGIMANLGYRYRHEKPAGLPVGDEITTAASVDFDLVPDTLALHGEVFGGFEVNTDESDGPHVPLEALAGIRWQAAPSLRVYAVAGPGLAHGLGAPDFRAVAGIRFSSRSPSEDGFGDQDGDGFADRDDDCPTDPEDADAFADDDGCPEADNDQDGILDNDDQCPDLPEETGGDKDGCPSHTYVKVENGELVIFGKVLFKTGSAEIQPKSAPLLDQIAVALKGSPDVGRVRIEGHTDDIGDEALNKSLSEERAASVRDALVERGVSEDRIEVRGYGESHPVAPNTTRAGRAKNRRVEFVITDK